MVDVEAPSVAPEPGPGERERSREGARESERRVAYARLGRGARSVVAGADEVAIVCVRARSRR